MPETLWRIRWPDGEEAECYSPSTVVAAHFREGERMPVPAFVARSRAALAAASERVRARYGVPCGRAAAQLAAIEARAAQSAPGDVTILTIDPA